jgi:hypothetical protein
MTGRCYRLTPGGLLTDDQATIRIVLEAQPVVNALREDRLEAIANRLADSPYRFENAIRKLRVIRGIAEGLLEQDSLELSTSITSSLAGQTQQLEPLVSQMETFAPANTDAAQTHTNIETGVEAQREWWVQAVRPSVHPATDIAGRAAEIEVARAASTGAAAEIEALLTQVRGAAGDAVAQSLSGYYARSAKGYSDRARQFLIAMIAAILALAGLAIYAFLIAPPPVHAGDQTTEVFIRSLLIRLLFLGIAGTAVAFTTRNYRVSKHLQVVNEAKQNALNTYGVFARSAPTADAATIITAELVRAVFGLPDTGFLSSGGDTTVIEAQPALTSLLHR